MSEHTGHRERMRQRFERDSGMDSFAPHEALELLLTYAIPRKDTNPIAHRLIERFGSLHAVLEAPVDELTAVPEIGTRAAQLISMLLPLYRLYENDRLKQRVRLDSYRLVRDYCWALYRGVTVEKFYLLSLDSRLKLIDARVLAEGTLGEVPVYPREVVAALLRQNAAGAVISHNHPGQTSAPSDADIRLTNELSGLLAALGITLYDHVIVGADGTFSFAQAGKMGEGRRESGLDAPGTPRTSGEI